MVNNTYKEMNKTHIIKDHSQGVVLMQFTIHLVMSQRTHVVYGIARLYCYNQHESCARKRGEGTTYSRVKRLMEYVVYEGN